MWKLACLQLSFKAVKAGILKTWNIWLSWVVRYQVDEVKIVIKPLCIPHLVQIAPQYPPRDRWARRPSSNWPAHKFEPSTISTFHHQQTCDPVNNMSSRVLYEISHPEKAKGMLCDTILPWWFSSAPTWLVLTVLTEDQAVNSRSRVWDISLPFQPMPCWALFPSHILSHPTTTAINQYYLTISTDTMWSKAILSQSQGSKLIGYWTLFFEPRISLLLPSTSSFQGMVLKAFAINTNGHHNPPVLSPDN